MKPYRRHPTFSTDGSPSLLTMPWRLKRYLAVTVCLLITTYVLTYWLFIRDNRTPNQASRQQQLHQERHISRFNVSNTKQTFNPDQGDVMVFLHIQKTGGTTFNSHLVDVDRSPPCVCVGGPREEGSCRCRTASGYTWLYSRLTTSWSCGVHPPLSNLRTCAPKFLAAADGYEDTASHRFVYVTVLRDPIRRYLSEWKHLQKTSPWPSECSVGDTMAKCLKDANQDHLTLEQFTQCPGNPANNRQVRMLALDSKHQCQDTDGVSDELATVRRAKKELENLAFFGLSDDQHETGELFQWTFNVNSRSAFEPNSQTEAEKVIESGSVSDGVMQQIRNNNRLDIELYKFALQLFYERYEMSKTTFR